MRVAVLSNCRVPTGARVPYGLGRTNHAIASGLAARGHDVTLFAGPGSAFDAGEIVIHQDERTRTIEGEFDVVLDSSHYHVFGLSSPDVTVVNRMGDRETRATVPCAVVETAYMRDLYPGARVVRKGVDVDAIPFSPDGGERVRYVGAMIRHKGYQAALEAARLTGVPVDLAGANDGGIDLPEYVGVLDGAALWSFIGGARCVLQPTTIDAAPRLPLEAAACGTPTVCLDGDGSAEHVAHCVSGFVVESVADMAAAISDAVLINRRKCREWVADTHPLRVMIDGYEAALVAAADGERW